MVHSCKIRSFFLVIPDKCYRESILPSVMPDSFYRASIWSSFRMDPRYQPAGMTTGTFSIKTTSSIYLTYPSIDTPVFTPYF